jgi:hypothetical protein
MRKKQNFGFACALYKVAKTFEIEDRITKYLDQTLNRILTQGNFGDCYLQSSFDLNRHLLFLLYNTKKIYISFQQINFAVKCSHG